MPTVGQIAAWRTYRKTIDPDGDLNDDAGHQLKHILKALGPIAASFEHDDHGEPWATEEKRYADFIIHAIWLCDLRGIPIDDLVTDRMSSFDDGFFNQGDS